ncbi:hypothetical protein BDR03DRAFT_951784, partial [Suillus americanus]
MFASRVIRFSSNVLMVWMILLDRSHCISQCVMPHFPFNLSYGYAEMVNPPVGRGLCAVCVHFFPSALQGIQCVLVARLLLLELVFLLPAFSISDGGVLTHGNITFAKIQYCFRLYCSMDELPSITDI